VADLQRVGEGLSPVFAAASEDESTRNLAGPLAPAPVPRVSGGAPRVSLPSPGRRLRVRLLAAAGALVALLGLLALGWSQGFGGPVVGSLGKAVEEAEQALGVGKGEVPKVVGLTEEEARGRLAEEGFGGVSVERRESSQKEKGEVLEQSVPAGKEVRRGSRIALAVGGGPRTVEAPHLVGLRPAKAEERLKEAGLELGERRETPSVGVPAGEVIAQDPPAGEETKRGTEVDLTVSSEPPHQGVPPAGGRTAAGDQYR
jgi:PASTA domain